LNVHDRTKQFFDHWRGTKWRRLFVAVGLLLLVLQYGQAARAQQRNENPTNPPSNLALQNLKQVAGSAPEIKAILSKDPELLVELKRWVAKDATDHGQIIGESELFIARHSILVKWRYDK
jgi:hypothetical protein